jgi:muconate cycloisomerase
MTVRSIHLHHIGVPLKKPIRHASHERTTSDNLVVRVTLADGTTGYGEGVPRDYVTGETIETTFATIASIDWAREIGDPTDYPAIVRRLDAFRLPENEADPRGMAGNAARCAVELAILDAYGQRFGRTLGDAIRCANDDGLPLTDTPTRVRYSGAITAESRRGEWISAWKMRLYGFAQVKLKVGVAGQDDPARLARFRRILGGRRDLRIDANEAWPAAEAVERARPLLLYRPTALEQPVAHREVECLAELRAKLGVPVMLDESLCGYPDATHAIAHRTADLFNVRLSKCGGILASLRIMALAHQHGLGVQLGCHPGETAILSAAGRHFAANVAGIRYVEGSYDRHILKENLSIEDITFRYGGWAAPLRGPGLGIKVNPEALARMTVKCQEIAYD